MPGHLGLPGESDREAGPEVRAQGPDEDLRGAVALVVLTLGVDDEALGTGARGANRGGGLTARISAVGERPAAHRDAGCLEAAHERRRELGIRSRAVGGLDVHGTRTAGDGQTGELSRRGRRGHLSDPQRGPAERRHPSRPHGSERRRVRPSRRRTQWRRSRPSAAASSRAPGGRMGEMARHRSHPDYVRPPDQNHTGTWVQAGSVRPDPPRGGGQSSMRRMNTSARA